MGWSDFVVLLSGFFQFPAQLIALIKILKQTPEEQHQAMIAKIQTESDAMKAGGRPSWG